MPTFIYIASVAVLIALIVAVGTLLALYLVVGVGKALRALVRLYRRHRQVVVPVVPVVLDLRYGPRHGRP